MSEIFTRIRVKLVVGNRWVQASRENGKRLVVKPGRLIIVKTIFNSPSMSLQTLLPGDNQADAVGTLRLPNPANPGFSAFWATPRITYYWEEQLDMTSLTWLDSLRRKDISCKHWHNLKVMISLRIFPGAWTTCCGSEFLAWDKTIPLAMASDFPWSLLAKNAMAWGQTLGQREVPHPDQPNLRLEAHRSCLKENFPGGFYIYMPNFAVGAKRKLRDDFLNKGCARGVQTDLR